MAAPPKRPSNKLKKAREEQWIPSRPIPDVRKETYARLFAEGLPVVQIEKQVGISHGTATDWSKRRTKAGKQIAARSNFLRAVAIKALPTPGELLHEIYISALDARTDRKYKEAIDAFKYLIEKQEEAKRSGIITVGSSSSDDEDIEDAKQLLAETDTGADDIEELSDAVAILGGELPPIEAAE